MDPRVVLAADVAFGGGSASAEEAADAIREGRLLDESVGGDALRTIVRRGGIDRAIHRAVGRELSRQLSDLGAGPRAPLRRLDPDRYLNFSVLGKGAMGIVFRALDTELKRDVAFKVIQSGHDDDARDPLSLTPLPTGEDFAELRARFLQEAWVTGGLEHPGIVPVYGLGETGAGVPFYSMRIVRGERTMLGAIEQANDLDARLGLLEPFLKVCDAVSYAHARGVIHRDLKPDNIALGDFGEVFVLDWGLAKLKDRPDLAEKRWHGRIQRFREETNLETLASALGTPGYMSPEAALVRTEDVDERSDVYSLGAILYQILAGKLPFEFKSYADMLEKTLKETPPAPTNVPGELARICLKGLAREPGDRFAGVDEIAAAIRAWQTESAVEREVAGLLERAEAAFESDQLDRAAMSCARILELKPKHPRACELQRACKTKRHELIAARERAARGKLLRRVAAVGLVAATAATIVVAVLLDARRQEAVEARERAEDLSGFMLVDLKESLERIGRLDLLGAVARKAKAYYDALPAADLTGDTLHKRLLAFENVAAVLEDEGDLPDALTALREMHAIAERLTRADAGNASWQRDLARSKSRLGHLLARQGRTGDALEQYRDAARVLEHGSDTATRLALARAQRDIAAALQRTGRPGEARRHYDEVLRTLEGLDPDPRALRVRALVLVSRGYTLMELGDAKAALASHRAALRIRRGERKRDPDNVRALDDCSESLRLVGQSLLQAGDMDGALGHFEEDLRIQRALAARDPANMAWQRSLADALTKVAHVLMWRDLAEAAKYRREALAVWRRLVGLDATNAAWRYRLAGALANHGMNLRKRNDIDGALEEYKEALGILEELTSNDPDNTEYAASHVATLLNTGHCYQAARDLEKALVYFEQCTERGRRLVEAAPDNRRYAQELGWALIDSGTVREDTGDPAGALASYEEARDLARPIVAGGQASVEWRRILAYSLTYAGRVMSKRAQWTEAEALAKEGLAVHTRLLNDAAHLRRDHGEFVTIYDGIALTSGKRRPETPADHYTLGYACFRRQQYVLAAEHFREALKDQAVRNDLQRSHLYNGACAASLASSVTKGTESAAWKREAVGYVRGALALWRGQLARIDELLERTPDRAAQLEPAKKQLLDLIEKARTGDPDLAAIRDLPDFRKLFGD